MATFLTIVLVAFAYLFVAGVIHKNWLPWRLKVCDACNGRTRYSCESDHTAAAFFASAFWPLALPVTLGTNGMAILGMSHGGKSRAERRREEEIAEAKHRQALAKIEADTTAQLERAAL